MWQVFRVCEGRVERSVEGLRGVWTGLSRAGVGLRPIRPRPTTPPTHRRRQAHTGDIDYSASPFVIYAPSSTPLLEENSI